MILRTAASLLLPSGCLACGIRPVDRLRAGAVCDACWLAVPALSEDRCGVCDESLPALEAAVCGRCVLDPPQFSRLRGAAPYAGSARAILVSFKFRGAGFLARHLALRMAERLGPGSEPFDEVVPVPATAFSRLRRDHAAEELAHALAGQLSARFSRRLRKVRRTLRQSGLAGARRSENVRGAFAARPGAPGRVLLVDDVATSGATARECARALRRAGAREVEVWCFARAGRDGEIDRLLSSAGGRPDEAA